MKGGFRTILAGASLAIMGAAWAIPTTPAKARPKEEPANVAPEPGHTRPRFSKRAIQREAARARALDTDPFRDAVNAMTNHERNHWARAGYPGLRGRSLKKLDAWQGRGKEAA